MSGRGGTNRSPAVRSLRIVRLAAAVWAFTAAGLAQDEAPLEFKVKAAFLLNFTKFIEWPAPAFPDARSPFTICILGKNPFGGALEAVIQGERVQGRRLVVQRIEQPPEPHACQILFLADPVSDLPKFLSSTGLGTLTVGDGPSFTHDGGMIGFVLDNDKIRFDINQSAAERAMLKLSSRLLKVARTVQR